MGVLRYMGIEDDSRWGADGLEDSWGPPIPPPPAEMPPPPPPVGDSNLSRTKGSAPPPPMPPPAATPQPVTPVAVDPSTVPVMQHSQQMLVHFFYPYEEQGLKRVSQFQLNIYH